MTSRRPKQPKVSVNCATCGATFLSGFYTGRKYCSNVCKWTFHQTPEDRVRRYWPKVNKGSADECWEWKGCRNSWGYGTFCWGSGLNINASRAAWLLQKGPIAAGLDVLHTCDNRLCCNVRHMYLGTDMDNARDRKLAALIDG